MLDEDDHSDKDDHSENAESLENFSNQVRGFCLGS